MLKAEYSIGNFTIKPDEKESYDEKVKEIEKEIDNNILNKILKSNLL